MSESIMKSVWSQTVELPEFSQLKGDIHTDVLIIGGGIAGILTAYFLHQNGVRYILAEKNRICSGTTQNTTAKITVQHGLIYQKILKSSGIEAAQKYYSANQCAFDKYRNLCKNISCDYEQKVIFCLMMLLGAYSLRDSNQVYQAADAANYIAYRPDAEDSVRFEELQRINPEVFAWLTVNDTPIDYPLTQTDNNTKYINTGVEGQYVLSGSIFLDYRNSPDFDDFNSILYGHHMEQNVMFGCLSDFTDQAYFDAHPYGNLYFNGQNHGIEFFAFILTDAYDNIIFCPAVTGEEERQKYIDTIISDAIHYREITLTTDDNIILLSTCTNSITSGRYLLIGKLTDELHLQESEIKAPVIRNGFGVEHQVERMKCLPMWVWIIILVLLIALLIAVGNCWGPKISHEKRE